MVDRCKINSKGQSLSINTVIITTLALLVLIVLSVLLFRSANQGEQDIDDFRCKNIVCVECNQFDKQSRDYKECYDKCYEANCKPKEK